MLDIEARDRQDSTREEAPLIKPAGAIEIDTSQKSLFQVVDELELIVHEHLPETEFPT